MPPPLDWLSRLLQMMPVSGHLDIRCFYGAPWRIDTGPSPAGEIPYHAVVSGSAVLETPGDGPPHQLKAGDILMLPHGGAHILHDGGGAAPAAVNNRVGMNLIISENTGTGDRLDMLCGHFVVAPEHDRMLRHFLPSILVVNASERDDSTERPSAGAQLANLVELMRNESAVENLGGDAMLNALSTAMFTLTLRLASELEEAPLGLLALAGNQRLAPALSAMFREPDRSWSLPELARLCNMSRATMARHFQERLGRSANELLTDIRMTLAANKLKTSSASTAAVAEEVGYQSEAAFQRAFKQRMGMTPAQWRRASHSSSMHESG
jgi:AraC family transcriptional regulator, activator of mtrCDE